MTLIYIASPYSHPDPAVRQKRYEDVSAYTAKRMMEGAVVYSPIAFNHPLSVRYEMPTDWVFWKHFDCRMIDKCDAMEVLMLDGWDTSVGVSAEVVYAREREMRVSWVSYPHPQASLGTEPQVIRCLGEVGRGITAPA